MTTAIANSTRFFTARLWIRYLGGFPASVW